MQVRIKKMHKNATIPTYSKDGDAGMDLISVSLTVDKQGNFVYDTGLAFEIPKGYVGLVFPRSSLSKYDLFLTNSVGVIDSGYRGSVKFKFKKRSDKTNKIYEVGDKIGQLMILPYPQINFKEVDDLSISERGLGGFGSTGK